MYAATSGFTEAKNDFLHASAEVNRSEKLVTVPKSNETWVTISPATNVASHDMVDVAADFMDEYVNVFEELAG